MPTGSRTRRRSFPRACGRRAGRLHRLAPGFGAVETGSCEIFLCRDGQGSRGKGANHSTFGPDGDETSDTGVWMSIWVDDVDAVHQRCVTNRLEITDPPTVHPWGVRELHVRHPDGHVFRISTNL